MAAASSEITVTDFNRRPIVSQDILAFIHKAVNPLTPNDHYSVRTAPLTFKVAFYIFIQQM